MSNSTNSSFFEEMNIEIQEWNEASITLHSRIEPRFINRQNVAHGGYLCALMDIAAAMAGTYCENNSRYASTLSLNSNFIAPVRGSFVKVYATMTGRGRKIFFSEVRAYDADGTLAATAQGTLRYRSGSE